jgi:DNA-binding beta-propeller fold protein YncE
VPTGVGTLSLLDARSGALLHTASVGVAPSALSLDARSGRVFVTNSGWLGDYAVARSAGTLSLADAASGRVLRSRPLGRNPGPVFVDPTRRRAYLRDDRHLRVFDTRSAALLQTLPISRNTTIVAATTQPGRLLLGQPCNSLGDSSGDDYTCLTLLDAWTLQPLSTLLLHSIYLYMAAVDEHLGHILLLFQYRANYGQIDIVSTKGVLVSNTVLAVGAADLAVDEQLSRAYLVSSPSGYALMEGGGLTSLYVLDTHSGRVLRTIDDVGEVDRGYAVAVAIDQRRSLVFAALAPYTMAPYVYTQPGAVIVFDARSGRRLARLPIGRGVPALAVDERTQRLFALSKDSNALYVFDERRL